MTGKRGSALPTPTGRPRLRAPSAEELGILEWHCALYVLELGVNVCSSPLAGHLSLASAPGST